MINSLIDTHTPHLGALFPSSIQEGNYGLRACKQRFHFFLVGSMRESETSAYFLV